MSAELRSIFGREVPLPFEDPYGPVVKARIPVPGLTRWPGRQILGRHYYGMDDPEGASTVQAATPGSVVAFNAEPVKLVGEDTEEACGMAGFADVGESKGLGSLGLSVPDGGFFPGVADPGVYRGPSDSSGGIDWNAIINAGIHSAPAIIQAAEGQGTPYGYYPGTTNVGYSTIPVGYTRDANGQLIPIQDARQLAGGIGAGAAQIGNSISNFVQQNPLLILGAGTLLLFLFMKPPGRR